MEMGGRKFQAVPRTRGDRVRIYDEYGWGSVDYISTIVVLLGQTSKSPVSASSLLTLIQDNAKKVQEVGSKVDDELLLAALRPDDGVPLTVAWLHSLTEVEYNNLKWEVARKNQTVVDPFAVLKEVLPRMLKLDKEQTPRCMRIIDKVATGEFDVEVFRDTSPESPSNGSATRMP